MSGSDDGPNAIHAVYTIRDILRSQWPTGNDAVEKPDIIADLDYTEYKTTQSYKSKTRWVGIIPGDDNVETWFGGQEYWHTLSIRFMIKSNIKPIAGRKSDVLRIADTVRVILRNNIRISPAYTQLIYRNSTNDYREHTYITHLTYTLEWQDTV